MVRGDQQAHEVLPARQVPAGPAGARQEPQAQQVPAGPTVRRARRAERSGSPASDLVDRIRRSRQRATRYATRRVHSAHRPDDRGRNFRFSCVDGPARRADSVPTRLRMMLGDIVRLVVHPSCSSDNDTDGVADHRPAGALDGEIRTADLRLRYSASRRCPQTAMDTCSHRIGRDSIGHRPLRRRPGGDWPPTSPWEVDSRHRARRRDHLGRSTSRWASRRTARI